MPDERGSAREHSTVSFLDVLREELKLIRTRRRFVQDTEAESPTRPDVIADAQTVSALGLAFSGGGIRSATFNLGVTQALAEKKLLRHVDYLSTVSGGGYIGTWLHGVVKSQPPPDPADNHQGEKFFDALDRTLLTGITREPGTPDTDPIAFLRKYSNYLAPRTGLFSADAWVIAVIWVRNVLLNQLILAPAIATSAAAAMLMVLVQQIPFIDTGNLGFNPVSAGIALIGLIIAVVVMAWNLNPIAKASVSPPPSDAERRSRTLAERLVPAVVLGVFVATIGVAFGDFDPFRPRIFAITWFPVVLLMIVIQVGGGFLECFVARHKKPLRSEATFWWLGLAQAAWMSVVGGTVTTLLIWAAWHVIPRLKPWDLVAFAPPLVAGSIIAGVMLLVGLMGADYPDAAREWTARVGARFAMLVVAWTALFALIGDGPPAVAELVHRLPRVGPAMIFTWLATTLGGVLAGRSPQTSTGEGKSTLSRALEVLVSVAPTLFIIAYVMAIAAGTNALLSRVAPPSAVAAASSGEQPAAERPQASGTTPDPSTCCCCPCGKTAGCSEPARPASSPYATNYRRVLSLDSLNDGYARLNGILMLLGGFVVVTLVASSRINVNEFSLHHFYKNRLVRCYLGASRARKRRPNALTGFDPGDDFPLAFLSANPQTESATADPYYGPYPIINTTLNLNAGSELAQQERKAASFVFTPAFCGFDPPSSRESVNQAAKEGLTPDGYHRTRRYSQPAGPNIGTTMAISGAAASPNWGYHTSGPVAFLLTVFNARLGWWLGNPRWDKASEKPGPVFALVYLIAELLGQTTGRSKFVNLSDGGHYDNLGLYELVRRRCRLIIVCDAEEDGQMTFGSLGAAIEKCRADFGVEIDITPDPIRKGPDGFSRSHCVVGRIRYPESEQAFNAGMTGGKTGDSRSRGWLLYLKSSLTGDEPADVIAYRSQFPEFPHQSTLDQFFSESQFESYRRLGYHVLRSAFEGVDLRSPTDPELIEHEQGQLVTLFQDLTSKWYKGIPVTPEAASRLADAWVALMKRLGESPSVQVKALFTEISSGIPSHQAIESPPPADLLAAGMAVIQLIQNVYTEFGLEHTFNMQNPRNQGWLETFRKWARSPILKRIWPIIENDYHPLFQHFIELLGEEHHPQEPEVL